MGVTRQLRWIYTHPDGADGFDEQRVWQQYTWSRNYGANNLLLRSRLEQRFVETGDDLGWRFRQFARLVRPFEAESRWALRVWDEVFVDLNDTDWGQNAGFAQNRLFAGVGWTFGASRRFTLEFGYLNQYLNRPSASDSMNHILATQLVFSL